MQKGLFDNYKCWADSFVLSFSCDGEMWSFSLHKRGEYLLIYRKIITLWVKKVALLFAK
jgi:hypothetical protein